nr:MAG TPA: nucleic-acid-binding protein [Caudoviricetes sp.]
MKCPKCQSENIRVELKSKLRGNIGLTTLGGILGGTIWGYSMAGFIGVIIIDTIFIILLCFIVGIVDSKKLSIGICQNCGTVFDAKTKEIIQ